MGEDEIRTWGIVEPVLTAAYMTVGAYAHIVRYFNNGYFVGGQKFPRKMKKRYFGTRSRWKRSNRVWTKRPRLPYQPRHITLACTVTNLSSQSEHSATTATAL